MIDNEKPNGTSSTREMVSYLMDRVDKVHDKLDTYHSQVSSTTTKVDKLEKVFYWFAGTVMSIMGWIIYFITGKA